MCYRGNCFISKKARTAKKDIKVFKFAIEAPGNKIIPYFFSRDFIYEEGMEYLSIINSYKEYDGTLIIRQGLHSYNRKLCWYRRKKSSHYINIHSLFLNPCMYYDDREGIRLVRLDCHIPKGSTYYINCSGEMVSDKLVVDKIQEA